MCAVVNRWRFLCGFWKLNNGWKYCSCVELSAGKLALSVLA